MILYNVRHRGPYEYDKFVLNIFQLYNDIAMLEERLATGSASQLAAAKEELDSYFDSIGGGSLAQETLLLSYQFE